MSVTDKFTYRIYENHYRLINLGTWVFPILNFFYEAWGIKNCGARLWHIKNNKPIRDPFMMSLPNGEKLIQLSVKPGMKEIENPIFRDLFEKNIDRLNSFVYGGKISIGKGHLVVENEIQLETLEDLKGLDSFPHKNIFESDALIDSLFHTEELKEELKLKIH
ncbi:hypothetical protein [Bacillus sp. JJ722]|uniref:hypothetical protein n=1 Tax=Bacillus sp. JJ722 TaxID=3122973 RepID=UPI002FFEF2E6